MRPIATDVAHCAVCVSVCVCVSVSVSGTWVSCAKTAEPIDMPFAVLTQVDQRNHVLAGVGSTSEIDRVF